MRLALNLIATIILIQFFLFGSVAIGDNESVLFLNTDRLALQVRVDRALDPGLREVNVGSYIFRRDRLGMAAVALLCHLARQGVTVRLLLDYYETRDGFFSMTPEIIALFRESGVELRYYNEFSIRDWINPIRAFQKFNHRMHEKIVTFNSDEAIVGGRNLSKNYFFTARERRVETKFNQFLDRDLYIRGEVAGAVYSRFMALWKSDNVTPAELATNVVISQELRSEVDRHLKEIFALRGKKDWSDRLLKIERAELVSDPIEKTGEVTGVAKTVYQLIDQAESSIIIEGPYMLMTKAMEAALRRARQRNVKVTLITAASDNNDMAIVAPEFERDIETLLKMGIEIYQENSFRNFHSKVFLIDDKTALVGSFNPDSRSERFNTEIAVKVTDPVFGLLVADDARQMISGSLHRTSTKFPEQWKKRGHPLPVTASADGMSTSAGEHLRCEALFDSVSKSKSGSADTVSQTGRNYRDDFLFRLKSRLLRPFL